MKLSSILRLGFQVAACLGCSAILAQVPGKTEPRYPTRPVKVIVAFSPGGGVDLMSRLVAQKLTEFLGQPVLVENRPGANGLIGSEAVARSTADGHTLLVTDRGGLTINPSLYKSLPYNPLKDFAYLGVSTELRYVVAINAALPISSLQELARMAKSRPGVLNFASVGTGSLIHLNFEQMNAHLGIELTHVPYKGTVRAVTAVLNNEASVMMSSFAGVAGFVRDGRLRPIAVGRPTRSPLLPEVPTVAEAGGGDDTVVAGYFTFAAPAGTPPPIVARLHAEISRIFALPDVVARLDLAGLEPQSTTPEAFTESVRRDIARFERLVKKLGITPQ